MKERIIIDELIKDRNELAKVSKEIKEHKNPKTNRDYRKGWECRQ